MSDKANPKKSTLKESILNLLLIVVIAILLRGIVIEAYKIPSGSMLPTLQIGDHLLVSKFDYGFRLPFIKKTLFNYSNPERHEIVVFTRLDDPQTRENESKKNIIKRVIGLPGEILEVRKTKVYINGKPLDEPYAVWVKGGLGNFGPYKIPEGKYFVMGDNRDESKDSRFWHDPFLPLNLIKGEAQIIYFNFNDFGRIFDVIR